MMQPITTTLIFGLVSGLAVLPLSIIPLSPWEGGVTFKILVFLNLLPYSLFLCRWSDSRPAPVIFPLLLVGGAALWPGSTMGFLLLALFVMGWIRSGICFKQRPLRAFCAELLSCGGAAGCIMFWQPGSALSLALVLWLFFLVQTLYFFMVPLQPPPPRRKQRTGPAPVPDSFERAYRDAAAIIRS